jgi:hypothetical protein
VSARLRIACKIAWLALLVLSFVALHSARHDFVYRAF